MICINHPVLQSVDTVWVLMTENDGREVLVSTSDSGNPVTTVCPACRDGWLTMAGRAVAASIGRPVEIVAFERRDTVAVFGATRN